MTDIEDSNADLFDEYSIDTQDLGSDWQDRILTIVKLAKLEYPSRFGFLIRPICSLICSLISCQTSAEKRVKNGKI